MKSLFDFFRKPLVQASIIGAIGGITPKLIEILPQLFKNIFPQNGYLLGLLILAFLGAVIIVVYKEENFQKALILGAGAPAIIAALTTQAIGPKPAGFISPFQFSIVAAAYAQDVPQNDTMRIVIKNNQSQFQLNSLWIRADSKTLQYKQKGDTLIIAYPAHSKEVSLDLPSQGENLVIQKSEVKKEPIDLNIISDPDRRGFWKAFGGSDVPQYRIEKKEKQK